MSPHIQSVLCELFEKYPDAESDQVTQRRIVREVCSLSLTVIRVSGIPFYSQSESSTMLAGKS